MRIEVLGWYWLLIPNFFLTQLMFWEKTTICFKFFPNWFNQVNSSNDFSHISSQISFSWRLNHIHGTACQIRWTFLFKWRFFLFHYDSFKSLISGSNRLLPSKNFFPWVLMHSTFFILIIFCRLTILKFPCIFPDIFSINLTQIFERLQISQCFYSCALILKHWKNNYTCRTLRQQTLDCLIDFKMQSSFREICF